MILSKKALGQKIKNARAKKTQEIGHKYTQEMLAEDLGISRSYLGDIEAGRIYPTYVLLSKISEICGVTGLVPGEDDKLNYNSQDEFVVKEDSTSYYTTSSPKYSLGSEDLTEEEYIAVKAFLETYRNHKKIE